MRAWSILNCFKFFLPRFTPTHTALPSPLWQIGEIEDQLDEEEDEDEEEVSSAEDEDSGSDDDDEEDGSTSSSEVDSVFGSDLDAGDDDLGPLRKSAVRCGGNVWCAWFLRIYPLGSSRGHWLQLSCVVVESFCGELLLVLLLSLSWRRW